MADFLLVHAAEYGNLQLVASLLRVGRYINELDKYGRTPLIVAALGGHLEIVTLVIEYGAEINYHDKSGWTALHWASTCNKLAVVSLLIEKGADFNFKNKAGETPLMSSSSSGYFSIVSLLLKNEADATLLNEYGETALDIARKRNKSADCIGILENYEHFHRYRKSWLSFATSFRSFQDNQIQHQNQETKEIQSQIQLQSPSLMGVMDSSDLVRFVTEYM